MGESFQDYSGILRLTFHRKSASKYWSRESIIAFLIYFQSDYRHLTIWTWNCEFLVGILILQVFRLEFESSGFWKFWTFTHVCFPFCLIFQMLGGVHCCKWKWVSSAKCSKSSMFGTPLGRGTCTRLFELKFGTHLNSEDRVYLVYVFFK